MNGQPDEIIGTIAMICFVGCFVWGYIESSGSNKTLDDWDMVPLGRVYNSKPRVAQKAKVQDSEFSKDCVSALVALGTRRTEAKEAAAKIFRNNSPKTVEEFLVLAFDKD